MESRFFYNVDDKSEPFHNEENVSDDISEALMRGVIRDLRASIKNPQDYTARTDPNVTIEEMAGVTAIQNRYSMMARWYEELFPVLEELHIGYVAFSPLANGFLSAKYGKDAKFDGAYDYRSMMPQFTSEAVDKNKELLTLLHRMAEEKESTPAQISLAWILCRKPYLVPIPGSRKEERLKENAGAADIILTASEMTALDEALETMEMSDVFGGSKIKKR
mgnify:CR=1 FL=1